MGSNMKIKILLYQFIAFFFYFHTDSWRWETSVSQKESLVNWRLLELGSHLTTWRNISRFKILLTTSRVAGGGYQQS